MATTSHEVDGWVLIVEDDADIREVMQQILEDDGLTIRAAGGGPEALAMLRDTAPPSLVLLDLMMPGMSGTEVCLAMRALPGMRDVPVLVISAAGRSVGELAQSIGAAAHVSKPVDLDVLIGTVRSLLGAPRPDARA